MLKTVPIHHQPKQRLEFSWDNSDKKHISRKSRWRDMESIDRKEVAWSYLDANNAEMYIKYSIETPNGLQRDLFKLKLSEIRKWIDMRKNNAKLFVTFIEQPNTINFYYKSYPYFTFDFDNEK